MLNPAYQKLDSLLAIVTTAADGASAGCVVNSVSQVAGGKLAVSINKDNYTCSMVEKAGLFTISVLTQEVAPQVLGDFGFRTGRELHKFENVPSMKDKKGIPYLTQDVAARFSCRVSQTVDLGSHMLFIGTVYEVENKLDAPVLFTSYFQKEKEGNIPQNAPVTGSGEVGWKCSVCGYILETDEIPANFKCPICGRGANMLVKR